MNEQLKQKLQSYKPSESTIDLIKSSKVLLFVGPTGAGKDYLKDALLKTDDYHHLVSHTTRRPRINHGVLEKDGREYFFVTPERAEEMVDAQEFVEVKIYSNNMYGTSVSEIQAAHDEGKVALTDVEVQGVTEFKELDSGVMAMFLLPPDFKIWQERLQGRYGDAVDVDDHKLRLQTALEELNELFIHDYYGVVISNDIDHSVAEVKNFVTNHVQDPEYVKEAQEVAKKLIEDIKAYLETI